MLAFFSKIARDQRKTRSRQISHETSLRNHRKPVQKSIRRTFETEFSFWTACRVIRVQEYSNCFVTKWLYIRGQHFPQVSEVLNLSIERAEPTLIPQYRQFIYPSPLNGTSHQLRNPRSNAKRIKPPYPRNHPASTIVTANPISFFSQTGPSNRKLSSRGIKVLASITINVSCSFSRWQRERSSST